MAGEIKAYVLEDLAPPWLLQPDGKATLGAYSDLKDELVDRLKAGVKLRFPLVADASALESIGKDNLIERGAGESDDSYRRRLAVAHETWGKSGTRAGVLAAIAAAGAPDASAGWSNAAIITNREWADDFGGVPPDADTSRWARFWVVISAPLGFSLDGFWADDGDWGDPDPLWGTADLDVTLDHIVRLLRTWAPFHARAMGVWFCEGASTTPDAVPDAAWWEPAQTFGTDFAIFWRLA